MHATLQRTTINCTPIIDETYDKCVTLIENINMKIVLQSLKNKKSKTLWHRSENYAWENYITLLIYAPWEHETGKINAPNSSANSNCSLIVSSFLRVSRIAEQFFHTNTSLVRCRTALLFDLLNMCFWQLHFILCNFWSELPLLYSTVGNWASKSLDG